MSVQPIISTFVSATVTQTTTVAPQEQQRDPTLLSDEVPRALVQPRQSSEEPTPGPSFVTAVASPPGTSNQISILCRPRSIFFRSMKSDLISCALAKILNLKKSHVIWNFESFVWFSSRFSINYAYHKLQPLLRQRLFPLYQWPQLRSEPVIARTPVIRRKPRTKKLASPRQRQVDLHSLRLHQQKLLFQSQQLQCALKMTTKLSW